MNIISEDKSLSFVIIGTQEGFAREAMFDLVSQ